jgi:GNAT superfamily N-acetyltransferase
VKLGPLHPGDVDAALVLSTHEGWNQTAADWSRLIRLEPSGCLAARDGSRLVGTVTTVTYGRGLAWIGMMIVHPDYRRKGIGAALMRRALEYAHGLGIESVKLDATPAGRPLYESLGFAAEAEVERWQGVARPASSSGPQGPIGESLPELLALDEAAYDVDRSRLLEPLAAESLGGPLVVESEHGVPMGCALARLGRTAAHIGPLIAASAVAAAQVLDAMLLRLEGREVCLDLHRGGFLDADALAARGLSKRRELSRMVHGARHEGGAGRSVCASAGPEFG